MKKMIRVEMNLVSYFLYLYIFVLFFNAVREKSEYIFDLACDSFIIILSLNSYHLTLLINEYLKTHFLTSYIIY